MIYSFDVPHKVGTVCAPGCRVCDPYGRGVIVDMTDQDGNYIPLQPLVILREATYEEQVAEMLADGATAMPAWGKYYYDVSTD